MRTAAPLATTCSGLCICSGMHLTGGDDRGIVANRIDNIIGLGVGIPDGRFCALPFALGARCGRTGSTSRSEHAGGSAFAKGWLAPRLGETIAVLVDSTPNAPLMSLWERCWHRQVGREQ